ncbi:hypothetical protein CA235_07490 [Sphingomonas sp. ABOLF]|uniref:phage tail length tape measure family protein n=1 Tax=Sphingomonas sp. ABOLF TaxID=1985879 RepID=UPI000F7F60D3|nr:phage tail length tape measure family protein [Sphingomonas sp. ABOLF]RSV15686.1 hypothetical protein CA235_07490 [Sphingomonas sp. ABOLF]
MAVTADSVVVELFAKTDGYNANINGAANTTASAMSKIEQSATRAEAQIARSAGAMANAQRNLGRQVADVGAQVAGGQSPFLILAQQAPQVADALADTGGRAAQVAAFFAGPWGAALLAAGSVLGVLVGKALEAGDSIEGLVEKLQESAAKTRLTAEAQQIFEATADGAAAAVDKLNESLGRANTTQERALALDLARAKSLREVAIRALVAAEAEAQRARDESKYASSNTFLLRAGPGGGQTQGLYAKEAADAERRLAEARERRAKAERSVAETSIPVIDGIAAAASDKAAAATRRHSLALQGLRDAYTAASAAARTNEERERAVRAYREGRTRIDVQLGRDQDAIREENRKGRRGPSAETLARRAEAARIRELRNNEAYYNELEQLNGQIIAAQRERAPNASEAAEFERQAIESDFRKRQQGIAADLSAGKYDDAQARTLNELNESARLLRLRNVAINEDVGRIREAAARDNLTLSIEQRQLRADTDIAESREQRRQNELRLIALQYQREKIELDALRSAAAVRGDIDTVNDVTEQIDALPGLQRAEETGVEQRYRGRYDDYRRSLDDVDQLADSVDAVKVNALEAVTDELTTATTAALGLKGAFGDIVGQLIRIGIQRRLIGPLADSLFGAATGGASTAGGFLSGLFGRASGGYVGPGQTVRVNEARGSGVELLRMGSAGGTVIPLGQAAAQRSAGNTTIVHAPQFNLKGAVVTRELYRDMQRISQQSAAQASGVAYKQAVEDGPARAGKLQTLGT